MKLTIERKALLTALNIVRPVTAGRITLPILAHVALRTFEKSVELVCTNLDLTLRTKCEAEIETKGQTTVSAAKLYALVNSFTGDDVTLTLDDQRLLVQCGSSKYHLGVLSYDEFPPQSPLKDSESLTLPQASFRQMLAVTSFCASQDESRYVLQGNLLKLDTHITTCATDGRRLALVSHKADEPIAAPRECIVPAATIKELQRLLATDAESKDRIRVVFGAQAAEFKLGDTVVTTKLIEGNYPNYKQVIPDTAGQKPVSLNRAELLLLLQRSTIIHDETVRLEFNRVSLTIRSLNTIGDGYENMDSSGCTKPLKIAFNPAYLIESLKAITDDEVLFFGTDDVSPGVFKVAASSPNAGWCYVVMPKRDNDPAEAKPAAADAAAGGANAPASPEEKSKKGKKAEAAPVEVEATAEPVAA